MKTKLEIINETAEYYSTDTTRRGLDVNGDCVYFTSKGQMCAVGRCLQDPKGIQIEANSLINQSISILVEQEILSTENFKPEYQIEDGGFWMQLQHFHDSEKYWDKDGLTEKGNSYLLNLREKYGA